MGLGWKKKVLTNESWRNKAGNLWRRFNFETTNTLFLASRLRQLSDMEEGINYTAEEIKTSPPRDCPPFRLCDSTFFFLIQKCLISFAKKKNKLNKQTKKLWDFSI